MFHKGKLAVFFGSALIVLYGVSAAFYGKVVAKDEAYKELSVFMDALDRINKDYVEAPDVSKVHEGAMRGLIDALDPYSVYLTKEQKQALEKRNQAGNGAAGMVLSKRADVIHVVATEKNGAADAAGLRPGDYLIDIDGKSLDSLSIMEADSLLRGAPGAKIKVTVFRNTRTKPVGLELTLRGNGGAPVSSQMLEGNIGLLELVSLNPANLEQARVKLKTLISAGAEKLILDLRDCADGDAALGAQLANFFLRDGVIYYSQNRLGEKVDEVKTDPQRFVTDLPMVVLINASTAGGAEIVAGALKDHKRATLVGEKSFGVGASQQQFSLKSGAVLVLSTAKYYTPAGKAIQEESIRTTGIKPDVQAPDNERQQDLLVESYYDEREDAAKYRELREQVSKEQLEKALEVLKQGVPAKKAA
jgi:carboxyl-terminal processing protease